MRWSLIGQFERAVYSPAENAIINLWFTNTGLTTLQITDMFLVFDYGLSYKLPSMIVNPSTRTFLGAHIIQLPHNVIGRRIFYINFRLEEYVSGDNWIDHGLQKPLVAL